jgi:uncharacterized membrane protein YdjX (TVP38/TMEM64 family)
MRKWLLFLVMYLVIAYIAYLNKEEIITWLRSGDNQLIPFMFVMSFIFATFPVVPFTLFAGIMGAKYGFLLGGIVNWFGAFLAACFFFLLSRYAFSEYLRGYIQRYQGLHKFTAMFERNAFLAVFFTRTVPIVPTPIVNIYSGISRMSFVTYTAATALGKIPGMLLYAYIGDQAFSSMANVVKAVSLYLLFVLSILAIYRVWLKSRNKVIIE